jgi:hypothetical protein
MMLTTTGPGRGRTLTDEEIAAVRRDAGPRRRPLYWGRINLGWAWAITTLLLLLNWINDIFHIAS